MSIRHIIRLLTKVRQSRPDESPMSTKMLSLYSQGLLKALVHQVKS